MVSLISLLTSHASEHKSHLSTAVEAAGQHSRSAVHRKEVGLMVVDHSHLAAAHIVPGSEEADHIVPGPEEADHIVPGPEEADHIVPDPPEAAHIVPGPEEADCIVPGPEEADHIVPGPEEAAHIVPDPEAAVHIVLDQGGPVHTRPVADHRFAEVDQHNRFAEVRRRNAQGRSELVAVVLASHL